MLGKNLIQAAAGNAAGEVLGVEDVFSTWLYTGNGSTQTITNGIDLAGEGGLVWIKRRNNVSWHFLTDTARGTNKQLVSNEANTGESYTNFITAFNGDGFSLGSNTSANNASDTYASWTFRKAPGFFDVVTYTGNGSNRTIAHSLGSVPGTIIIKRTDASADWQVYHRSLANTEYLVLNSTAAKATGTTRWNSTTPTSSVFSLGTDTTVNASGGTYVAYLFAHDEQIFGEAGDQSVIKCGSYTGNSSTTGNAISLGWEPQWLMIKSLDLTATSTGWHIYDNMRGILTGGDEQCLSANLSSEENGSGTGGNADLVDFDATGFTVKSNSFAVNNSSSSYIYIAIRRGPMKTPTAGTDVFDIELFTEIIPSGTNLPTGFPVDLIGQARYSNSPSGLYLTPRLTTKYLAPHSTAREGGNDLFWDRNDGIGINSFFNNKSGTLEINYLFRRAPGFFDVVAYTGNNAGSFNHALGVVPEMILIKRRDAIQQWCVYHAFDSSQYGVLNSTAAFTTASAASRFSSPPTSSVFTLGGDSDVNTGSAKYIAYLFASCPGVSKVGSYTGTGNSSLNVNCGFTAGSRFVLIKRTDSTGDWYVWDSARGLTVFSAPYLLLNSSAAEVTGTTYINSISSGFSVSAASPQIPVNITGASYIFLAIA